jgi:hypothetical protein
VERRYLHTQHSGEILRIMWNNPLLGIVKVLETSYTNQIIAANIRKNKQFTAFKVIK